MCATYKMSHKYLCFNLFILISKCMQEGFFEYYNSKHNGKTWRGQKGKCSKLRSNSETYNGKHIYMCITNLCITDEPQI